MPLPSGDRRLVAPTARRTRTEITTILAPMHRGGLRCSSLTNARDAHDWRSWFRTGPDRQCRCRRVVHIRCAGAISEHRPLATTSLLTRTTRHDLCRGASARLVARGGPACRIATCGVVSRSPIRRRVAACEVAACEDDVAQGMLEACGSIDDRPPRCTRGGFCGNVYRECTDRRVGEMSVSEALTGKSHAQRGAVAKR